jgi:acetyl esterase/lipase
MLNQYSIFCNHFSQQQTMAQQATSGNPTPKGVRTMTTVTTQLGNITGKSENDIQMFLGVPYAKPPVGERRFQAPELHGPWSGTLDATRLGNRAMQPGNPTAPPSQEPFSEDCLTVDIYTPAADGRARPVLFWIHGGAYYIGSGNDHDGSILAAQGDVVVVAVNYRLGVFGFLDLSKYDDDLAGSASNGFRDQILALTWVRDNINDYGGDPNNVTIFGESAGGGSVNAILAAPSADGLYHRAIAHSGTAITNPPASLSTELAAHLEVDESELLTHLKQLSAEDLLAAQLGAGVLGEACVDGVVITRDTYQAIAERGARGVPYIAGSNLHEGTFMTSFAPDGTPFDPMTAVLGAMPFDLLRVGTEPAEYVTATFIPLRLARHSTSGSIPRCSAAQLSAQVNPSLQLGRAAGCTVSICPPPSWTALSAPPTAARLHSPSTTMRARRFHVFPSPTTTIRRTRWSSNWRSNGQTRCWPSRALAIPTALVCRTGLLIRPINVRS